MSNTITLSHVQTRRAIDWLQSVYVTLIFLQILCVLLYNFTALATSWITLTIGVVTSFAGPVLSFFVSMHVFLHHKHSRIFDFVRVGFTYAVTCTSFGIVYVIIAARSVHAFTLPTGSADPLDFGSALYFSFVTITTTGYGDITPLSGPARLASCLEIATGLLYQVFTFSLGASLFAADRAPTS